MKRTCRRLWYLLQAAGEERLQVAEDGFLCHTDLFALLLQPLLKQLHLLRSKITSFAEQPAGGENSVGRVWTFPAESRRRCVRYLKEPRSRVVLFLTSCRLLWAERLKQVSRSWQCLMCSSTQSCRAALTASSLRRGRRSHMARGTGRADRRTALTAGCWRPSVRRVPCWTL